MRVRLTSPRGETVVDGTFISSEAVRFTMPPHEQHGPLPCDVAVAIGGSSWTVTPLRFQVGLGEVVGQQWAGQQWAVQLQRWTSTCLPAASPGYLPTNTPCSTLPTCYRRPAWLMGLVCCLRYAACSSAFHGFRVSS